jgi:hypothetical protein
LLQFFDKFCDEADDTPNPMRQEDKQ